MIDQTLRVFTLALALVCCGFAEVSAVAASEGSGVLAAPPTLACEPKTATTEIAVVPTSLNTVWYDHFHLSPACERPLVVRVADGEYFQVVIGNTDSTEFSYTITAVPDQEVPASGAGVQGPGVPATRFATTSLAMRHSSAFARYRVKIELRSDLAPPATRTPPKPDAAGGGAEQPAPKLYPAAFDVWVKTKARFEVAFTGGVAFSSLRSPQFFVRTDDHGTAATTDDTKTVEEDSSAKDAFRPDVIAIANLRFPDKARGLGLAFGVGLNNDSDPRYFMGPSLFLGRHFLLHAGWTGGRVDRLPSGQELSRAPINGDNTLSTLPKRFAHGFYVSVGFAFVPGAEDKFKGAFGSSQKPTAPAVAASTDDAPPPPPAADLSALSGKYREGGAKEAVAEVTGKSLKLAIKEIATGKTDEKTLAHTESLTFADGSFACTFAKKSKGLECTDGGKAVFKGTRVD